MSPQESAAESVAAQHQSAQYQEIAPLELDFSELDSAQSHAAEGSTENNSPGWLLPAVAITAVLALLVVFLLPRFIGSGDDLAAQTSPNSPNSQASGSERSPWQEAQDEKNRQAAQAALEPLLERQTQLEEVGVEFWAADAMLEVATLAEQGDLAYRQRDFAAADARYSEALAIVNRLWDGLENTRQSYLQQGTEAVNAGNAAAAQQAFDIVLAIDAQNPAALHGLQRLAVLDEVQKRLASAAAAQESAGLQDALEHLRAVIKLDADRAETLQPRIAQLESALLEQNYAGLMSQGYRLLDQGQQSAALQSFAQAAELKPQASEPGKAIRQVRNSQNLSRMDVHFRQAAAHERQEQWSAAVKSYAAALSIDPNLSDAAEKKRYAEHRQKLDAALATLNADPLRLADAEIYSKAVKLHAAGAQEPSPGPRLQQQLSLLSVQLEQSKKALPVIIRSDGLTRVSVQRVARLGMLQQQRLSLRPGRYVAIGVRDGYRDVRREFTVPQGAQDVQVDVRCVEQI